MGNDNPLIELTDDAIAEMAKKYANPTTVEERILHNAVRREVYHRGLDEYVAFEHGRAELPR